MTLRTRSCLRLHAARRLARLWAALALSFALLALLAGCSAPADVSRDGAGDTSAATMPAADATGAVETWDRKALAQATPCLVMLSDAEPRLRAVSTSGTIITDYLWQPPRGAVPLLLDVDEDGPSVALALSRQPTETPAAIRDDLVVLDRHGVVVTASAPTTTFPLVSSALFLGNDVLWLRRAETQTSVETTVGMTELSSGTTRPVSMAGTWPRYRFVAALVPIREANEVAVVLKVDGTTSPHDDFAVVPARYADGVLTALSSAYRDDTLFTLAAGPAPDTLVYARAQSDESSRADQLIELEPSAAAWRARSLLESAGCDPGFDFQHVCGPGPAGGVLYREAVDFSAPPSAARLMFLPAGASRPETTGVRLDVLGSQWMWLERGRR